MRAPRARHSHWVRAKEALIPSPSPSTEDMAETNSKAEQTNIEWAAAQIYMSKAQPAPGAPGPSPHIPYPPVLLPPREHLPHPAFYPLSVEPRRQWIIRHPPRSHSGHWPGLKHGEWRAQLASALWCLFGIRPSPLRLEARRAVLWGPPSPPPLLVQPLDMSIQPIR